MNLADRERVDGTRVTIGRRVRTRNGRVRVSRVYTAEYRDLDGSQACESLGTTSKSRARREAIEIQQRLERGLDRPSETNIHIHELTERYLASVEARDVAPKTIWKYRSDCRKLKEFCADAGITLARRLTEDDLFRYRQQLVNHGYAPKTVQGAVVLAQQVFKWGWRRKLLREYQLAGVSLSKARPRPQPCFTSEQADKLIAAATGEEKAAFALMAYAGLRIGEVEQLRWEDLHRAGGELTMIHIRREGSRGVTKDKDDRFVPIHPKVAEQLSSPRRTGPVFRTVSERQLLKRLKELCATCKFRDPTQYKLHSFRHHFASLCANHQVAYRKALAWLGHSSSEMLDLYYHLHDDDSHQAMQALADSTQVRLKNGDSDAGVEDHLRTTGQSTIEKLSQVLEFQELTDCLAEGTERAGFEPADGCPSPVFKTGAFSHSATSPIDCKITRYI